MAAVDFTERSTGLFPDINKNDMYQNTGNRGCAACHTNLFDMIKDNGTYVHLTNYVGLKNATYYGDCYICHNEEAALAGNTFSENMHIMHYSSQEFVSKNGNCWSCHTMIADTPTGEKSFELIEKVMYEPKYGGYPAATDQLTQWWAKSRGFETGFLSGVTTVSDPKLEISFNQDINEEEDEFLIWNMERVDGNDTYHAIDMNTWRFEVKGANEAVSLTLDELKAMPETEFTAAHWCFVSGDNTAMVANKPMKGVLLEDFIEVVGGVPEGANTVKPLACDGWTGVFPDGQASLQCLIDAGAVLVYGNYGHDLELMQGAPVTLFVPGAGGTTSIKNLVGIEFSTTEAPLNAVESVTPFFDAELFIGFSTTWFDNDGVQAKVGQPLVLEGAGYGWSIDTMHCNTKQIMFSLDYGQTWQTFDVPESFDPKQWARFTLTWTPEESGTYIIKQKAVAADGTIQENESNLIVTVFE